MPNSERKPLQPSGDLQAAILAIQAEVVKMAASARAGDEAATAPEAPRRPRAEARRAATSPFASGSTATETRAVLRVLTSLTDERGQPAPQGRREGPRRASRKRRSRGLRRTRPGSGVHPAPPLGASPALVGSIAEEIHAATTVIAGWIELLDRGMLAEDEVSIACQRIRAAQTRIEAAGERLQLAVGISPKRLRVVEGPEEDSRDR